MLCGRGGVTGVVVSGGLLAGSARLIQAPTRCRDGSGGNAGGQAGTRAHLSLSSLCVCYGCCIGEGCSLAGSGRFPSGLGGASSGWNPLRAHSQCLALLPYRGWREDLLEKKQQLACALPPQQLHYRPSTPPGRALRRARLRLSRHSRASLAWNRRTRRRCRQQWQPRGSESDIFRQAVATGPSHIFQHFQGPFTP